MQTVIVKAKNTLTIEVRDNVVTTLNEITIGRFAGKSIRTSQTFPTNKIAYNHYRKVVNLNQDREIGNEN